MGYWLEDGNGKYLGDLASNAGIIDLSGQGGALASFLETGEADYELAHAVYQQCQSVPELAYIAEMLKQFDALPIIVTDGAGEADDQADEEPDQDAAEPDDETNVPAEKNQSRALTKDGPDDEARDETGKWSGGSGLGRAQQRAPAEMRGSEINAELDKLEVKASHANDALIAAGHGSVKYNDLHTLDHPAAKDALRINARQQQLRQEVEQRAGPGNRRLPHGVGRSPRTK